MNFGGRKKKLIDTYLNKKNDFDVNRFLLKIRVYHRCYFPLTLSNMVNLSQEIILVSGLLLVFRLLFLLFKVMNMFFLWCVWYFWSKYGWEWVFLDPKHHNINFPPTGSRWNLGRTSNTSPFFFKKSRSERQIIRFVKKI